MKQIVTADIGGTHARFAIAEIGGGAISITSPVTFNTGEFASFEDAWEAFGRTVGHGLPGALAIAFAGPIDQRPLKLSNNRWVLDPAKITATLGVDRVTVVNDFSAVAHAVANAGPEHFSHLCGPDGVLPKQGAITIVGPGTGLGVALLVRSAERYEVIASEGGHADFAPVDEVENRIAAHLRSKYGRVSVERVVSGPGLIDIFDALSGAPSSAGDARATWQAALDGSDERAGQALERLCRSMGSVAGDFALIHGSAAVVIAGGLGRRMAAALPASGFRERFLRKGRLQPRMEALPVKLLTYPEAGLFGAAAAFAMDMA